MNEMEAVPTLNILRDTIRAGIYFVPCSLKSHHLNDEGGNNKGDGSFLTHKDP